MRTDWRPCEDGPDGDPCEKETCYICTKFRTDLRYSYLWRAPKPVTPPPPHRWRLYWNRFLVERLYPARNRAARVLRFLLASAKHAASGMPRATAEDVAARRAQCGPCVFRDQEKDFCMNCGCSLGERRLLSKIAWAKERCPIDRWGPVRGETVFRRAFNWLSRGWR